MKTAISLPDTVFEQADELASRLKISRSELYVMALEKFIKECQVQDLTKQINDVIDAIGQPAADLSHNVYHDMRKVEW